MELGQQKGKVYKNAEIYKRKQKQLRQRKEEEEKDSKFQADCKYEKEFSLFKKMQLKLFSYARMKLFVCITIINSKLNFISNTKGLIECKNSKVNTTGVKNVDGNIFRNGPFHELGTVTTSYIKEQIFPHS